MKRFGLIGYPVKHSYSASMHNAAFRELGLGARYELFEVLPEQLEREFKNLLQQGVYGLNLTIPHKEKIIQFLDHLESTAGLIGAVNTVKISPDKTTEGFNTDGSGFITHLKDIVGFGLKNKHISILGAGGAAKAISVQLAKNNVASIAIFDLEQNKAKALTTRLQENFPTQIHLVSQANLLLRDQPDLLINATPSGMHKNDQLVFDSTLFHRKLVVYDLIYNPAQTPLLQEARRKGCAMAFNGLGMLLYQGVLSFKIWLDIDPPVKVMEEALQRMAA